MHLSILSDCFAPAPRRPRGLASDLRGHRDGMLRGLLVVAVAGLLAGLTLLGDLAQPAAARTPPPCAVASSSGAAVNLMHKEVTRH